MQSGHLFHVKHLATVTDLMRQLSLLSSLEAGVCSEDQAITTRNPGALSIFHRPSLVLSGLDGCCEKHTAAPF